MTPKKGPNTPKNCATPASPVTPVTAQSIQSNQAPPHVKKRRKQLKRLKNSGLNKSLLGEFNRAEQEDNSELLKRFIEILKIRSDNSGQTACASEVNLPNGIHRF